MKKIVKTALFEHILKKSTHPLFGAWSLLLVHVRFTPSQGHKKHFKEIGPWKCYHEVTLCKNAL